MTADSTSFVGWFYALLASFALVTVSLTNLRPQDVLYGLVFIGFIFWVFRRGALQARSLRQGAVPELSGGRFTASTTANVVNMGPWLLLSTTAVVASVCATLLATGLDPAGVIRAYGSGGSVYNEYQFYTQQVAGGTVVDNALYVLLAGYVQVATMCIFLRFLSFRNGFRRSVNCALLLAIIAAVYPGLARGTSFEFFKCAAVISFALWLGRSGKRSLRSVTLQALVGAGAISMFLYNVAARQVSGRSRCLTSDVCTEPAYEGSFLAPILGTFKFVYGYFGHGIYYLNELLSDVILASPASIIRAVLPVWFDTKPAYRVQILDSVDIGVMWHPDASLILNSVGLIGLILATFAMGYASEILIKNGSVLALVGSFMITLQMMSLPVGNFISISPENYLVVFVVFVWWVNGKVGQSALRPAVAHRD